jgi:phosphotransferase system enzyme I (PtsP)
MARNLLARLREIMARATAPLAELVPLVAAELVTEVCSVYALRPGDILELVATVGLRPEAVGRTRLRVGEGIVGVSAATGQVLNLPDVQNHPAFVYRPETGEELFLSMLAVPIRRAGRIVGVVTVQNRLPRTYTADEVEALETVAMVLAELLSSVGAAEGAEQGVGTTLPRRFAAVPLSRGIAIGPVVLQGLPKPPRKLFATDPDAERARLAEAMRVVRAGLDELIAARVSHHATPSGTRDILEAYRLIASDAGWLRRATNAIASGLTAEAAVYRVMQETRETMRRVQDPYLSERIADLEDLAFRVQAALEKEEARSAVPGAILIARRLGAAELLEWHAREIAGLVLEEASAGSHAAIIARGLGLPLASGARGLLDAAEEGEEAILDAEEGALILRPEAEVIQAYRRMLADRQTRAASWNALRHRPASSRDGTPIRLLLNVGMPRELDQLDATGAEGIGLFRTEIVMLAHGRILDMGEQTALYRRVIERAANRPVVFRTLDLGGDKLLPESPKPRQENPAMGWRSLRVGLDRPAFLRRQLRALLTAAAERPLSVMFPMVATLEEFRIARGILLAERDRVQPGPERLSIGAMLEVPALLWQMDHVLKEADFISIGTNDLLQFLFAADRHTPELFSRYDFLSPAILDLFETLRAKADAAGRELSVCGDVASRPLEALVLAALGLTTLSVPASAVLPLKALFAAVDLDAFRHVLATIRAAAAGEASLREPIANWAREQGLPI